MRVVVVLLVLLAGIFGSAPAQASANSSNETLIEYPFKGIEKEFVIQSNDLEVLKASGVSFKVLDQSPAGILVRLESKTDLQTAASMNIQMTPNQTLVLPTLSQDQNGFWRMGVGEKMSSQTIVPYWFQALGLDNTEELSDGDIEYAQPVSVCVLDSAVDSSKWFGDALRLGKGWNYTTLLGQQNTHASSLYFEGIHGTSVTSLVREGVGPLPVTITPYTVLSDRFGGDSFSLASAIRKATQDGCQVMNLSLGFKENTKDLLVTSAMRFAADSGVVMVVAAGNEAGFPSFPANLVRDLGMAQSILSVIAVDSAMSRATFSNRPFPGSMEYQRMLAAPGVGICTDVPDFYDPDGMDCMDGTSFAAPLVTAAMAYTMSTRDMDAVEAANFLLQNARQVGGGDEYGMGIPSVDPGKPNPLVFGVEHELQVSQDAESIQIKAKTLDAGTLTAYVDCFEGQPSEVQKSLTLEKSEQGQPAEWSGEVPICGANSKHHVYRQIRLVAEGPGGVYSASSTFYHEGVLDESQIPEPELGFGTRRYFECGESINATLTEWSGHWDEVRVFSGYGFFIADLGTYSRYMDNIHKLECTDQTLIFAPQWDGRTTGVFYYPITVTEEGTGEEKPFPVTLGGSRNLSQTDPNFWALSECWGMKVTWEVTLNGTVVLNAYKSVSMIDLRQVLFDSEAAAGYTPNPGDRIEVGYTCEDDWGTYSASPVTFQVDAELFQTHTLFLPLVTKGG